MPKVLLWKYGPVKTPVTRKSFFITTNNRHLQKKYNYYKSILNSHQEQEAIRSQYGRQDNNDHIPVHPNTEGAKGLPV